MALFTPRSRIQASAGIFPPILTPAQDGGKWYTLIPASSPRGRNSGTHLIERWVHPTAGLDVLEKKKIQVSYFCRDLNPRLSSTQRVAIRTAQARLKDVNAGLLLEFFLLITTRLL